MGLLDILWRGTTPDMSDFEPEPVFEVEEARSTPLLTAAQAQAISERSYRDAIAHLRSIDGADIYPSVQQGRPVRSNWSTRKAVREGLSATSWIFVCVYKIAHAVSSIPLVVQQRQGAKDWVTLESHPLAELLAHPNEYQDGQTLLELWLVFFLLGGEAYIGKNRAGFAAPQELWVKHPDELKPVAGKGGYLSHYEHWLGGRKQPDQPTEDIVSLLSPDPNNPLRGLSPLRAGGAVVETDREAVNWQKNQLKNSAVPSMAIEDPEEHDVEKFVDEKKKLDLRHVGSDNARRTIYVDGDKRIKSLSLSPVDLDFINSRKFTREEITALYEIPPPVVGIMDRATYNNIKTAWEIFWRNPVSRHIHLICRVLTHQLARPDYGDDIRVWPDTSAIPEISQLDEKTIKVAKGLHDMGVPVSEINRRLRLELQEYPGWDESHPPSKNNPQGSDAVANN